MLRNTKYKDFQGTGPVSEAKLKAEMDAYKARIYAQYGVDPNKGADIEARGYQGPAGVIKSLPAGSEFWDPNYVNKDGTKGAKRWRKADENNASHDDTHTLEKMRSPETDGWDGSKHGFFENIGHGIFGQGESPPTTSTAADPAQDMVNDALRGG